MTGPPRWRAGVDRAAHRRTDPQWLDAAWARARVLVIDPSARALCTPEPALVFVPPAEAPAGDGEAGDGEAGERLFLGVDADGTPYFAVVAELPDRPGARAATLREVGSGLSERDADLLGTATALMNWHATHRYVPRSGEATTAAAGGWLRVGTDGSHVFPRTDPAVIVLVHDGVAGPDGQCLLGSNAARAVGRDGSRFFSTLAGFVEPGESAEAAVAREVHEEVGVRVSELRYEGSQPWPYPGSLMLGFTGLADPAQPLRPDGSEIAVARWFTRAGVATALAGERDPRGFVQGLAAPDLPVRLPGPASIAYRLIHTWAHRDP